MCRFFICSQNSFHVQGALHFSQISGHLIFLHNSRIRNLFGYSWLCRAYSNSENVIGLKYPSRIMNSKHLCFKSSGGTNQNLNCFTSLIILSCNETSFIRHTLFFYFLFKGNLFSRIKLKKDRKPFFKKIN